MTDLDPKIKDFNPEMPITFTDKAVEVIKAKTAQNTESIGLRVVITTMGCSGNGYEMEHVLEEDLSKDDKYEANGAVLYIAKTQSWMIFGMEIDYAKDGLNEAFQFNNPNEIGRCGCGESVMFTPKPS